MSNSTPACVLTYDIGSTGCKTCLYAVADKLRITDSAIAEYTFRTLPNGGVEQDPDAWWSAMVSTTREIISRNPEAVVAGISFCAQMQALVLVDHDLRPLRPAMTYMDQRSGRQRAEVLENGIQVEGMNAVKLLRSLAVNGAVAASVKDPVWKYLWVKDNEPEVFARAHRWLDVKDYLVARATGRATMTADSAFATFLTAKKDGHRTWSPGLLNMYGVKPDHMPRIVGSTEQVGGLLESAAVDLGLPAGTPVIAGGGDASMISVGAGATRTGDTYVYTGTSGWVAMVVDKPAVDISRRIAGITGAQDDRFLYFAEQETAGKCLEWVRDHLALDEIDLYLDQRDVTHDPASCFESLYDFLIDTITQVPAGSDGVIFTPWLHGNRAPFDDPASRGIFFNLSLGTGKRAMIRAVVEGIIFHQRWLMDSIEHKYKVTGPVGFVGGGALSPVIAQMVSDILERPVRRLADPRHAGAAGAAITTGVGLDIIGSFDDAAGLLEVEGVHAPSAADREVYRRNYAVFRNLYASNRRNFTALNGRG